MLIGSEAASDIPIANRFKFVDWQNFGPLPEGATQPCTLEFRQHKGTEDGRDRTVNMLHSPNADSRMTSSTGYIAYFADQATCTSQRADLAKAKTVQIQICLHDPQGQNGTNSSTCSSCCGRPSSIGWPGTRGLFLTCSLGCLTA